MRMMSQNFYESHITICGELDEAHNMRAGLSNGPDGRAESYGVVSIS